MSWGGPERIVWWGRSHCRKWTVVTLFDLDCDIWGISSLQLLGISMCFPISTWVPFLAWSVETLMCTDIALLCGKKLTSEWHRWMAGLKENLVGVQNSLARRKPKNSMVQAAQMRRFVWRLRWADWASCFLGLWPWWADNSVGLHLVFWVCLWGDTWAVVHQQSVGSWYPSSMCQKRIAELYSLIVPWEIPAVAKSALNRRSVSSDVGNGCRWCMQKALKCFIPLLGNIFWLMVRLPGSGSTVVGTSGDQRDYWSQLADALDLHMW